MSNNSLEPKFNETEIKPIITETALALAGVKNNSWEPLGTCVVIARNFAITAKHVVEHYFSKIEGIKKLKGSLQGKGEIFARQIIGKENTGRLWKVKRVWLSPITDVAFLYLAPRNQTANEYKWKCPQLKVSPPSIGSKIVGFGYHSSKINLDKIEDVLKVEWNDKPTTTIGEVKEIFDHKRDSVLLNFPCYRVNARFDHGMSGGPVFDKYGYLCGLICLGESEDYNRTHVVSLWPSLSTYVNLSFPKNPTGEKIRVYDVATHGQIKIVDLAKVKISQKDHSEGTISLNTDPEINSG